MSHTILLIQRNPSEKSRTYMEFPTIPAAMAGIVTLFEERLKRSTNKSTASYTLSDLEKFIDDCKDFGALVFNNKDGVYAPKSKDWIKKGLGKHIIHLSKKASSS